MWFVTLETYMHKLDCIHVLRSLSSHIAAQHSVSSYLTCVTFWCLCWYSIQVYSSIPITRPIAARSGFAAFAQRVQRVSVCKHVAHHFVAARGGQR